MTGYTIGQWSKHEVFGDRRPDSDDEFVYHYTSLASASAIALTSQLSLSPMWAMNDPAESWFPEIITMTTGDQDHAPRRVSREDREATRSELKNRRDRVRLVCFGRDATHGTEIGSAAHAAGRGFAQTSMWAHYGDNHKGVVLVLRRALVESALQDTFAEKGFVGDVQYVAGFSSERAQMQTIGFDSDPNQVFESRIRPTLLLKSAHWAQEREFRALVLDWPDPECLLPIQDLVAGVVFGHSFEAFRFETARRVADDLCGVENAALLGLNNLVLQPSPVVDSNGDARWWTLADRHSGAMFD